MSHVIRGLHWKRCLVYIDDILVFGNDFESVLHSLELVLIRVAEYGLQLKSTKCNLFRTSVPFLGHIVGRAGLECGPNKLSAVANCIPPSTIKGVRKFLGFTGYYRRFVPDYCNELGVDMARFTQFHPMIPRWAIIYEIISPGATDSSIWI